ncbi:MAG: M20 family metallopeptidase [Thermoleophilaceae bacterium]
MDERALCERLITYDTSAAEGIQSAAGFVKGWLEARDIDVRSGVHKGRPVLAATVGAASGPTVVLHGHLDVVPGRAEQFQPRVEGDRLIGRGAYDMKGGLAGMMCATRDLASQSDVRVHFACVSDEENDDDSDKGSDWLISRGYGGNFAVTGEPTDLKIGVQAKGVVAVRIEVQGKAAHGSTPWLGDNAVLKAVDVFRQIESLPFARESSDLFDRPSINLGRVLGGDALNKVPDSCVIDVDIRYLPGQDRDEIVAAIDALPDTHVAVLFERNPAIVEPDDPFVRALADAVREDSDPVSVGRDGASDAVSFQNAGVPAVEFGPTGDGHHGPEEWVSIASLESYRRSLVDFVHLVPKALGATRLRIA